MSVNDQQLGPIETHLSNERENSYFAESSLGIPFPEFIVYPDFFVMDENGEVMMLNGSSIPESSIPPSSIPPSSIPPSKPLVILQSIKRSSFF